MSAAGKDSECLVRTCPETSGPDRQSRNESSPDTCIVELAHLCGGNIQSADRSVIVHFPGIIGNCPSLGTIFLQDGKLSTRKVLLSLLLSKNVELPVVDADGSSPTRPTVTTSRIVHVVLEYKQ